MKMNKTHRKTHRKKKGGKTRTIHKKANCNPAVIGKTANPETCFTSEIIHKIKNAYNTEHPENKITETNPNRIWKIMHEKFSKCETEECWLHKINNVSIREHIENHSFTPKQPESWKKNRNEWLSNHDILAVLQQYEQAHPDFKFIGPSFIDFDAPIQEGVKHNENQCVTEELCKFSINDYIRKKINKIGIIFNLDKHTQSGSHWVSLFIDIHDKFIFYLDSAGVEIPDEIQELVDRIVDQGSRLSEPIQFQFIESRNKHQLENTECGMYSLFFIITMVSNKIGNGDKKFSNKSKKIDFFLKRRIPDKYVEQFRDLYFRP